MANSKTAAAKATAKKKQKAPPNAQQLALIATTKDILRSIEKIMLEGSDGLQKSDIRKWQKTIKLRVDVAASRLQEPFDEFSL